MFIELIITKIESLRKYLLILKIDLLLTQSQKRYMVSFMLGMILKEYNGKIADINEILFERHRTNIGKFLSDSPWDENLVTKSLNKYTINKMLENSKKTGNPIYIMIDDTISKRTKPSSKAKKPIELCSYHYSHLEGKKVYGHQLLTVTIQCGDTILPLYIGVYEKEKKSKIQMAIDVIKTLPKPPNGGFILCDSWYSGKNLIREAVEAGYTYIGALRTNRIIYPDFCNSLGIRISNISKKLSQNDVHLVKVGNQEYYVYEYRGKFNGVKDAVIVISWQKEHLFEPRSVKAFICTDKSVTSSEVLTHYVKRWPIEIFFRETKRNLGLNDYQVRSEKSIKRYILLVMLTYTFCELNGSKQKIGFGTKLLKSIRNSIEQVKIEWLYTQFSKGKSLSEVLDCRKIA